MALYSDPKHCQPPRTDTVGMVLAAGMGSRLAPYTDRVPKPLVPLFDVPMITFAIARLAAANIDRVVINTCHRCEPLEAYLETLSSTLFQGLEICVSREDVLLGTGGGIARARPFFGGRPVLVVNSDLYFDFPLRTLIDMHERTGASATALLHDGQGFDRFRSTLVDDAGAVTFIGKAVPSDTNRRVFAGAYLLAPDVIDQLPEEPCSVIAEGFQPLFRQGQRVSGVVGDFLWCDVGTWPAYFDLCQKVLLATPENRAYRPIWEASPGRFVAAGDTVGPLSGPGYIGPEVRWDGEARLGPGTVLQRGVTVGAGRWEGLVTLPEVGVEGPCAAGILGPGFHVSI